jgi:hypothetical protein|nr:MAG TPA: DNA polymerase [Caudoviricetes sp.]
MARILCNFDVGSLYPNLVRLYGYSSRSQKDKNAYVNLLDMRMKAKHGKLSEDVLKPMGLTNDDLKTGLKLPLNAYTGTLRASFNKNADFKQGFGICTTGQLLILQLVYDLQKIPTLEMVSTNTDAVMFTIEEEYKPQVLQVIKDWEDLTGLEMEEDKIVKIVMRDVNSYCEIVQVGDNDFKVNYKGGEFKGKHKFKWNKEERIFEYSFDDEIEANSLTIVSEALLKKLLFDIPIEDTINNCNDIFRFQMITHLGGTYEKCVQESPNGDIELQRNNRIYASNGTSGTIIKVKPDGRRDSLALCPPNPIVDNKNECTIEDVNKSWYIKIANQKLNDFLGIKRLTEYKKDELLTMAKDLGLEVDKKTKKDELIKIIEERNEVKEMATKKVETNEETKGMNIYEKLNKMKEEISTIDFVLDKILPSNMGSGEYASIGQLYTALHTECLKYNVYFQWDVIEVGEPKELFKPTGKLPQHVWDGTWKATFINIDNTNEVVTITTKASGSDICDKGISSSSTMAFRNFFDKNFTPKYLNQGGEEVIPSEEEKTEAPKIPAYIPPQKKEEIKEEVVSTKQNSTDEDIKRVIDTIMKIRDMSNNPEYGKSTLNTIMTTEITAADLLSIELKLNNKLDELGGNK